MKIYKWKIAACHSLLKLCNKYTGIYYTTIFTFVYIWHLSAISLKVSYSMWNSTYNHVTILFSLGHSLLTEIGRNSPFAILNQWFYTLSITKISFNVYF